MMDQMLDMFITYGIFAGLFVWLLHTTNKRNELREDMYQEIIKENQCVIAEQSKAWISISRDMKEIKYDLRKDRLI